MNLIEQLDIGLSVVCIALFVLYGGIVLLRVPFAKWSASFLKRILHKYEKEMVANKASDNQSAQTWAQVLAVAVAVMPMYACGIKLGDTAGISERDLTSDTKEFFDENAWARPAAAGFALVYLMANALASPLSAKRWPAALVAASGLILLPWLKKRWRIEPPMDRIIEALSKIVALSLRVEGNMARAGRLIRA